MDGSELYPLWVKQHYASACRVVKNDESALIGLNPDGTYARDIRRMMELHQQVVTIYKQALDALPQDRVPA